MATWSRDYSLRSKHRGLGQRIASDAITKACEEGTRTLSAKTVNEELHSLKHSCERIQRRLNAKPGDAKLMELLAKQETKLALAIGAAHDGRTYRHRG